MSALKVYKIEKDYLKRKLKSNNLSNCEFQELEERLANVKNKMKSVSEKPLCELLDGIRGRIDWLTISCVYMNALRSPEECENMWNNVLDFSVNKEAFTKDEDEELLYLAEIHNEREWDLIADSLQTNRTAIQCFVRYQRKLNKKRRFWSKNEDDRLLTIIKELKHREFIPWDKVSKLMECRTCLQCKNRYKLISQTSATEPWTSEEYALLIACYDKFGPQWTKIRTFFRRRSVNAIRSRYVLSLDPSLKFCSWTIEEDKHLISLIKKYGYGKWAKLSRDMPGRSSFMCLRRAELLLKHSFNEGTEYDQVIYNPEQFARILRPFGPKISSYPKVRTVREDAIVALLKAIEEVLPDVDVDIANLNFSWLSIEQLYHVSEELHNTFLEREKLKPPVSIHRNYPTKPLYRRTWFADETNIDETNVEETDVDDPVDEIQMCPVKGGERNEWWYSVLAIFIKMQSMNMQPPAKRGSQALTETDFAEISLYKEFLFKRFNCLSLCDDEDGVENFFSDIDYPETLQAVVHYCIQPILFYNQFTVLAPNLTTICGLEVAEITESRLISMSEFVSHSKDYIEFICERRKSCPKCLQCLNRNDEQRTVKNAENQNEALLQHMISCMIEKHFIVNEAIESSAYVEAASKERCFETCSCNSLEASLKSVQLLKRRFRALFLWPTLLAATSLTEKQNELLCKKKSKMDHFPKDGEKYYPRKKKRKLVSKRTGGAAPRLKQTKRKRKRNFELPKTSQKSKRICVGERNINYSENSE